MTGSNGGNGSGGGSGENELHPFVQGLLRELPTPHSDWPLEGRKKWLQSALSIFDLIYQSTDGDSSQRLCVGFIDHCLEVFESLDCYDRYGAVRDEARAALK